MHIPMRNIQLYIYMLYISKFKYTRDVLYERYMHIVKRLSSLCKIVITFNKV